jgi:hypothetical protein
MTKDYVLHNLRQVAEDLNLTIKEIEAVGDYGDAEFRAAMVHLYRLLNLAWNARRESLETVSNGTAEDLSQWRRFPPDIDMILRL